MPIPMLSIYIASSLIIFTLRPSCHRTDSLREHPVLSRIIDGDDFVRRVTRARSRRAATSGDDTDDSGELLASLNSVKKQPWDGLGAVGGSLGSRGGVDVRDLLSEDYALLTAVEDWDTLLVEVVEADFAELVIERAELGAVVRNVIEGRARVADGDVGEDVSEVLRVAHDIGHVEELSNG